MKRRVLFGLACLIALAATALLVGLASGASSASLANAPWTIESVVMPNPTWDAGPYISMDSDGEGGAVIAYNTENSVGFNTAHWEPGSFTQLTISGLTVTHNSIAHYWTGSVHKIMIIYYESEDRHLHYLLQDFDENWVATGAAQLGAVDTGNLFQGLFYPSVAFDSNGIAHLAYYENNTLSGDALVYAYWVGSAGDCPSSAAWECEDVATGEGVGRYASLEIDGSDNPHIAYYDGTNNGAWVASYSGSTWTPRKVWRDGLDSGEHVALAVGDSGTDLHVAFYNVTSDTLDYANYVGTGGNCGYDNAAFVFRWECETIEPVGTFASEVVRPIDIGVDESSYPVIAYQNAALTERRLRVARPREAHDLQVGNCGPEDGLWNTWYCDTVDPGGLYQSQTGRAVAMEVNSAGAATVLYRYHSVLSTEDNLRIAYQRTELFLPVVLKN